MLRVVPVVISAIGVALGCLLGSAGLVVPGLLLAVATAWLFSPVQVVEVPHHMPLNDEATIRYDERERLLSLLAQNPDVIARTPQCAVLAADPRAVDSIRARIRMFWEDHPWQADEDRMAAG